MAKLTLNAQLTVAWENTPLFDKTTWPKLQTALFDKIARHLKQHGITSAYAWTRESQTGKGAHTHVGLHLGGKPHKIVAELKRQLDQSFGFDPEGIEFNIGERRDGGSGYGLKKHTMRKGMLQYALKAMDHADFRYTGIGYETENIGHILNIEHRGGQGIIPIKRAGVSQNINKAARKAGGWTEIRELARLGITLAENV